MPENLLAALIGGLVSAMRHRDNIFKAMRVALTGFALAYFAASDVAYYVNELGFAVSTGAAFFLVGYFGADLLDKAVYIIRIYKETKQWS